MMTGEEIDEGSPTPACVAGRRRFPSGATWKSVLESGGPQNEIVRKAESATADPLPTEGL